VGRKGPGNDQSAALNGNGTLIASVVVPVRGRPRELSDCLSAIAGQKLCHGGLEVLICDDGSEPPLRADEFAPSIAGEYTKWLRQEPRGPAAARNLGVHVASSPVVIFVDSDVILDASCIATLVRALDANPDWLGAEARLEPVGEGEGPLWDAPTSTAGGHYHTAAIAYRKNALKDTGGFDETFVFAACEDVDLAVRILAVGPIGFVPEARAFHPRRRVNFATHWKWRTHWFYTMVLAVRYGILAFPGRPAGPWPRLRVALAACCTLPLGRVREALGHLNISPSEALRALCLALFDVVVGLCVLPAVLFGRVPERADYLALREGAGGRD